jgi:nucleotide-binding universal stress UspA family protein
MDMAGSVSVLTGLDSREAAARLAADGPNAVAKPRTPTAPGSAPGARKAHADAPARRAAARREPSQPGPMSGDWRRIFEQGAEQTLVDALRWVTGGIAPDVVCRMVARHGFPADALLAYADRDDDLLVLGAGRGGLSGLFGQRTVHRCVRKSVCPVVVVPPVAPAPTVPVRKLLRAGIGR